jgi:hypothetical protein
MEEESKLAKAALMLSAGTATEGRYQGNEQPQSHHAGHSSRALFLIGITLSVEFIRLTASSQAIMSYTLELFQGRRENRVLLLFVGTSAFRRKGEINGRPSAPL